MVKFGFALSMGATIPWDTKLAFAEEVERLGYDAYCNPHFLGRDVHGFDCLDTLAAIAVRTNRIKLLTGVLQVPLYNPVDLARRVTTIDHMSNGRLVLGIGVGWIPREFEMQGVPFNERGKRCDESLEIMNRLWTEEGEIEYQGKFYNVSELAMEPKPVQKPHPPLLYGGGFWSSGERWAPGAGPLEGVIEPAMRRMVKYCNGWIPEISQGPDAIRAGMDAIKERAAKMGRPITDEEFDLTGVSYAAINIDDTPAKAEEEAHRFYATRVKKGFYQVQGNPAFETLKERGAFGPPRVVADLVDNWVSIQEDVPALKRIIIMFASLDPIRQLRRFHIEVEPLLKR